jgi:hypothetical protein
VIGLITVESSLFAINPLAPDRKDHCHHDRAKEKIDQGEELQAA